MRVALWFAEQPYRISPFEIGLNRGMKIYGIGRQGEFGDVTDEKPDGKKPSFVDIIGTMKWNAWKENEGVDRVIAQKATIKLLHDILREYKFESAIEDPKRPGPNYYDDCIKFNWVDALVKNHKEDGYGKEYEATKEEMEALLKLTNAKNIYPILAASAGTLLYSLY